MKPARPQQWKFGKAGLPSRVLAIATGEGIARASNLLLAVFISRTFGVRAAGAYALAIGLSLYLMQGIDFGLRHTGTRLIGQAQANVATVVRFVQRRRILLAFVMIAAGYCYGRFGPVPQDTRTMVSLYALSMLGYGFSLDWMAWGMQRFTLMSGWRALTSLLCAASAILWIKYRGAGLLILPLANGLAYLIADSWLWFGWAHKYVTPSATNSTAASPSLTPDWKSTAMLGVAMLVNQAFNSVDTLMLGSLTDSAQTGLYSAAYRLLLLVLAIYYLVMQAVYPEFATIPVSARNIQSLLRPLVIVIVVGIAAAAVMGALRSWLIVFLYGHAFAASARLAAPLVFAIPLDFATSLLVTALVAWDHPRRVLTATTTAVAANVLLNCFLIPRYKAMGAAFATPLSYLPFLLMLLWQLHRSANTQPSTDLTTVPQTGGAA